MKPDPIARSSRSAHPIKTDLPNISRRGRAINTTVNVVYIGSCYCLVLPIALVSEAPESTVLGEPSTQEAPPAAIFANTIHDCFCRATLVTQLAHIRTFGAVLVDLRTGNS